MILFKITKLTTQDTKKSSTIHMRHKLRKKIERNREIDVKNNNYHFYRLGRIYHVEFLFNKNSGDMAVCIII